MQPQDKRTIPVDLVLSYLPIEHARLYRMFHHVRVEVLRAGDQLVAYEMAGRSPQIRDIIEIDSLEIDPKSGLIVHAGSNKTDEAVEISVLPQLLLGLRVFVFLPLNPGLRFEPSPSDIHQGELCFPLVIRTASRMSMREQGVLHLEKRKDFEETFGVI